MIKRIFAGVFAFIFAMLLAAVCSFLFIIPIAMGEKLSFANYVILIAGCAGVALAIAGGVFAILRKSIGFVFVWVAIQVVACPIASVIAFSGILTDMSGFVKVLTIIGSFLPLVLGCVILILAEKPKNILAYITELINICGSLALYIYSIYYLGSVFAGGFACFGLLGCGLLNGAIVRARKGLSFSFELTILSGLCQAAQFVFILTASGVLGNAYLVLLGMLSILLISVGGILVGDNLESGFIILAFGIISFAILLLILVLTIGSSFAFITFITMLGLIIHVAETLIVRIRENDKIIKSI